MRISNSVTILLAALFFYLGGQGEALAAEADASAGTTAPQAKPSAVVAGRIYFVDGEVQAVSAAGDARILRKDDSINAGDTLISAATASAQIRMEDGGLIALRSSTRLTIDSFRFSGQEDGSESSFFTLNQGGFRAVTGVIGRTNKHNYRITTPAAIIGVAGTDHDIVYLPDNTPDAPAGVYNKVNAGATTLTTDAGMVIIEPGQMGYAAGMSEVPQLLAIDPVIFGDAEAIAVPDAAAVAAFPPAAAGIPMDAQGQVQPIAPGGGVESESGGGTEAEGDLAEADGEDEALAGEETPLFVPAPIAWGGDVSESYRKLSYSGGVSDVYHVQAVNLRAASYIWQPWLARVNGGVGVVNAKQVSGDGDNTSDVAFNGRAGVSVAPYSRFPFFAAYGIGDSRATAQGYTPTSDISIGRSKTLEVRQNYRSQLSTNNSMLTYNRRQDDIQRSALVREGRRTISRLQLKHSYRPLRSLSTYTAGYDRRTAGTEVDPVEISTGWNGIYTTRIDNQRITANITRSESERGADSSQFGTFSVRHAYQPDKLLSVNSSAYTSQSSQHSSALRDSNMRNLQANTGILWQPDEELPFFVSSTARFYKTQFDGSGELNTSQTWVVDANVNYNATPNLAYLISETYSSARSGNISTQSTVTGAKVNYRSDDNRIGEATHNWNAKGGVDYTTSSQYNNSLKIFADAGHGIRVPYMLDNGRLDFSANQSLGVSNDQLLGNSQTLVHGGGVVWKAPLDSTISNTVSLTVSDMRNFGDVSYSGQTTNVQAAELVVRSQGRISATSDIMASAGKQWRANDLGQTADSTTVSIIYHHIRVFDVKGLRYSLTINAGNYQTDDDNPSSRNETIDRSLVEQKLEYRIGRAYLRLLGTVLEINNRRRSLLVLQLGRSFGAI